MRSDRERRLDVGAWRGVEGIRNRILLLFLVLMGGLVLVLGRAVHLQVVQRDWLGDLARSQVHRVLDLAPHRGEIFDRDGRTLATSVEVDSIFVDPLLLGATIEERRAVFDALARAAELTPAQAARVAERLDIPNNRFVWLRRRVPPAVAERVRDLDLPGVGFVKEPTRFYPHRETAAQILGIVGEDGRGLEGIERQYDEVLRGRGASIPALRDARGRALFAEAPAPATHRRGSTIHLTLDHAIQYLTEKALADGIERHEARAGSAVVLDVHTGEILALASQPAFNPNLPPSARQREAVRHRALTDPFEPGSVMKAFLLAGGVERGLLHESDRFDCENGAWRVGRHRIHDSKPYRWLTLPRILHVSSNVCTGKIGLELGAETVEAIYREFGFGRRIGVDLPGEASGRVGPMRREIELVTASFGQGPIMATSLQIAAAMAALGNGGRLLAPWLVRAIEEPDGTRTFEGGPQEIGRPVSERTARTLLRWLEGVVDEGGTGTLAALERYPVAGKTGTSQKADPATGGYGRERIASFAGVVPADAPRLAIAVVVDEPQKEKYGGKVAAPIFRAIAEGALGVLGVSPSRTTPHDWERLVALAPEEEAEDALRPLAEEDEALRAPSLLGLGAREAVRRAGEVGLLVRLQGTGRVVSQDPPAGAPVERGEEIVVRLRGP